MSNVYGRSELRFIVYYENRFNKYPTVLMAFHVFSYCLRFNRIQIMFPTENLKLSIKKKNVESQQVFIINIFLFIWSLYL